MASWIYPVGSDPATYRGLPYLYEYINGDGKHRKFNCGQAASCTLLTHCKVLKPEPTVEEAQGIFREIEGEFGPNLFGGWFGTSRKRVEAICADRGIELEEVSGIEELKHRLDDGRPVIVMMGTETARFLKLSIPGGHWMVAYGYDQHQIFLSNYSTPGIPWAEFLRNWGTTVPRLINMRNIGLGAVSRIAEAVPEPTPAAPNSDPTTTV